MIVRPGSAGFELAALLPMLGALAMRVDGGGPPDGPDRDSRRHGLLGNICFLICALALSAVYGSGALAQTSHPAMAFLTRGWIAPSGRDLALMASCG